MTRPVHRNGFGLTVTEAEREVRVIEPGMSLLSDSEAVYREWRRIVVQHAVSGVQGARRASGGRHACSRAKRAGIENLAPDDLRRSCARLCHQCGGELEQIQFLLGNASVQTPERYIRCKQNLNGAFNDRFGISVAGDAA